MTDRDVGGGRDRMQKIRNQIMSWWGTSNWADSDKADRASEEFVENYDRHINPELSASANWEIVKAEFNLTTRRDEQTEYDDRADELYQRVRNTVFDSIDEHGVDEWVRAVNDDPFDEPIPEVAQVRDDVLEQTSDLGITPDTVRDWVMDHLEGQLNALGGTFEPRTVFDPEQAERIERDTRADVIRRIQNRYGVAGGADDLEDVLEALEARFRREGGPDVQTAPIRVRTSVGGTYSVSFDVDPGRARIFDAFRGDVRDQIAREIGEQAIIDAPGKSYDVGTIRLEDGELAGIDLTAARDRFGAQGPPAAPAGRAGWNKARDSRTRVAYEKPEAVTRSEGATRTVLVVEYDDDADRWELIIEEREPVDDGGAIVASTPEMTGRDALPTREAALDVAARYMENNPFDADRATAQSGADELEELLNAAGAGFETFTASATGEQLRDATAALEAGLGGDVARELAALLNNVQPQQVSEALAEERGLADGPGDIPLSDFLDALPGYDPPRPEPDESVGIEARELSAEERGARRRIRSTIEAGAPDDANPLTYYAEIQRALERGSTHDPAVISQRDLDVLSPELRDRLADEVERVREKVRQANLEPEDFPEIWRKVERLARTANRQTVDKATDILRGDRENDDYFDPDELDELRKIDHVVEQMVEYLEQNYHNRKQRNQRGDNRNLGGFEGGQPEPGLSDDDFREYMDSAANYQYGSGGPDGSGGLGRRDPYDDTSRRSGKRITRYPVFERQFEALIRDLGKRRIFDQTNMELFWKLTPEEQREWYDRTAYEWLRLWVRDGTVTRSQLYNRGFDESAIPPVEDEEYANRGPNEDFDPGPLSDQQDTDLTPGERAVRDALDDDRDDDDVSEGFGSLFGDDDDDDADDDDDDADDDQEASDDE